MKILFQLCWLRFSHSFFFVLFFLFIYLNVAQFWLSYLQFYGVCIFQATAPLLKTPLSQAQQAYSAAAATYTAVAGMRAAAYGAAAAAQPVAGYAAVAG